MPLSSACTSHRSLRAAAACIAIALAVFVGSGFCRAQAPPTASDNRTVYLERIRIADSLHRASDFAAACETFETAFNTHPDCILPYHLYNTACAAALAGRTDAAFGWLHARMKAEPEWYSDRFASDAHLASLQGDPRWQPLADSLVRRQELAERNFDRPLRKQLLDLLDADQQVRIRYLPVLREAAAVGELAPASLALFEDRIAVSDGCPQRYGTQILQHSDGSYHVAPLENRDSLDTWRSRVGLAPMEVYVKRWNIVCK